MCPSLSELDYWHSWSDAASTYRHIIKQKLTALFVHRSACHWMTISHHWNSDWKCLMASWWIMICIYHIDGLVQERCNSSALAMELHLSSCTNPVLYTLSLILDSVVMRPNFTNRKYVRLISKLDATTMLIIILILLINSFQALISSTSSVKSCFINALQPNALSKFALHFKFYTIARNLMSVTCRIYIIF